MGNSTDKKILHVTGAMNIGGTETMLINLYKKVYKNVEFDFISYSKEKAIYDKQIEALGGKVIRLDPPSEVGFINSVKDLMKVIKKHGPYNAVHTHMLFNSGIAMIAAYLAGIKVRVSHSHTTADNSTSIIRKLYIGSMRILIKVFSTDYLACSNAAATYLFGKKINKNKKYMFLPNYINYEEFIQDGDKNSIRKEISLNCDDVVIGHIGRFVPAKNHQYLIDIINTIVKQNQSIKLLLIGDGQTRKEIESKVKALNLENNVIFLGLRDDVSRMLKAMDIFILPSTYEGLGLVLLEAQASKLDCIVSEAIQPEVDLEVGLVKKLKISDGANRWANEIINIIDKKEEKNIDIIQAVKDKKYGLDSIIETLSKVYKVDLR